MGSKSLFAQMSGIFSTESHGLTFEEQHDPEINSKCSAQGESFPVAPYLDDAFELHVSIFQDAGTEYAKL